jgi:hypothetical protein
LSHESHWPFGGFAKQGPAVRAAARNHGAREQVFAVGHKGPTRYDRFLVGGKAHTRKKGLS